MGIPSINDIKKWFNKVERAAKDGMNQINRGVNDGINKLKNEATGCVNWIKGEGDKAVNTVKSTGQDVGREVEKGVRGVANEAEKELRKVGKEVESQGKKVIAEVEDKVEQYLDQLAKALTKQGLIKLRDMCRSAHKEMEKLEKSRPALADSINNVSITMKIGPVTMVFTNFYDRAEDLTISLDRFISEPPAFRRGPILFLVSALGPTTIDLGISVELALVVGSDELGIGGELSEIELELGIEIADVIMEKLGVPA